MNDRKSDDKLEAEKVDLVLEDANTIHLELLKDLEKDLGKINTKDDLKNHLETIAVVLSHGITISSCQPLPPELGTKLYVRDFVKETEQGKVKNIQAGAYYVRSQADHPLQILMKKIQKQCKTDTSRSILMGQGLLDERKSGQQFPFVQSFILHFKEFIEKDKDDISKSLPVITNLIKDEIKNISFAIKERKNIEASKPKEPERPRVSESFSGTDTPDPKDIDAKQVEGKGTYSDNFRKNAENIIEKIRKANIGSSAFEIQKEVENYPCLMIKLKEGFFTQGLDEQNMENGWTQLVMSYFIGLVNYYGYERYGEDYVHVIRRQSFGHIYPTITDAGTNIRFSLGMIDEDYSEVINESLKKLQADLQFFKNYEFPAPTSTEQTSFNTCISKLIHKGEEEGAGYDENETPGKPIDVVTMGFEAPHGEGVEHRHSAVYTAFRQEEFKMLAPEIALQCLAVTNDETGYKANPFGDFFNAAVMERVKLSKNSATTLDSEPGKKERVDFASKTWKQIKDTHDYLQGKVLNQEGTREKLMPNSHLLRAYEKLLEIAEKDIQSDKEWQLYNAKKGGELLSSLHERIDKFILSKRLGQNKVQTFNQLAYDYSQLYNIYQIYRVVRHPILKKHAAITRASDDRFSDVSSVLTQHEDKKIEQKRFLFSGGMQAFLAILKSQQNIQELCDVRHNAAASEMYFEAFCPAGGGTLSDCLVGSKELKQPGKVKRGGKTDKFRCFFFDIAPCITHVLDKDPVLLLDKVKGKLKEAKDKNSIVIVIDTTALPVEGEREILNQLVLDDKNKDFIFLTVRSDVKINTSGVDKSVSSTIMMYTYSELKNDLHPIRDKLREELSEQSKIISSVGVQQTSDRRLARLTYGRGETATLKKSTSLLSDSAPPKPDKRPKSTNSHSGDEDEPKPKISRYKKQRK